MWVGLIRRRILSHIPTILLGVTCILLMACALTPIMVAPAAAKTNVSVHLSAHRVPTRIKPSNLLAKHVQVVLTVLLVRQVVHTLQLLVQLGLTQVAQLHVKLVMLVCTITRLDDLVAKMTAAPGRILNQIKLPA